MSKGYLAVIEPAEPIKNKENCLCSVTYVTGDLNHTREFYRVDANVFSHYFHGAAFEYVTKDDSRGIVEIRDIQKEDLSQFPLTIAHALTLNNSGSISLASNGTVYNLEQSVFAQQFPHLLQHTLFGLQLKNRNEPCALRYYLVNGEIVYIEVRNNINPDSPTYRYALSPGFAVQDKAVLQTIFPPK